MSPRRLAPLAALAASFAIAGPHPARAAAPDREAVKTTEGSPEQESERELEAGLADYAKADYASAIEHFERAYALHPSPQYLYAWAQAARSAGDCVAAVELYRRFIAAGATGASLEAARQNEARCSEQIAAAAEAAEDDAPPEPPPPEPAPVVDAPPEPTRSRPDRLGLALVVTGGAAMAAGAAVLAVAGTRRATQAETTDYDRFDALDQQILRLDVAGGATLGVGAALAIAGVIRLTTKSRRNRSAPQAGLARVPRVTPSIDARGTPLVLLRIALP